MTDGSEKRNRQLALELQNSHVCEKRSKLLFDFASRTTTKLEIFAKRNKDGDKRDIRIVLKTEISVSPCDEPRLLKSNFRVKQLCFPMGSTSNGPNLSMKASNESHTGYPRFLMCAV